MRLIDERQIKRKKKGFVIAIAAFEAITFVVVVVVVVLVNIESRKFRLQSRLPLGRRTPFST